MSYDHNAKGNANNALLDRVEDNFIPRRSSRELILNQKPTLLTPTLIFLDGFNHMTRGKKVIFLTLSILTILLMWLSLTPLTEKAFSHGEVMFVNDVSTITHGKQGIIATILINKGQHVQKGDVLATLSTGSEVDKLLAMKKQRQQLLDQIAEQKLLQQMNMSYKQAMSQETKRPVTANELSNQLYATQVALLNSRYNAGGTIDSYSGNIANKKIKRLEQKLNQVNTNIAAIHKNLHYAEVRAPSDAIIKNLAVKTGDLIMAGQAMMEIIPMTTLYVQTNIAEKELSAVTIGNDAVVRIPSQSSQQHLVYKGVVHSISSSVFTDENNNSYYKGLVAVNQAGISKADNKFALRPGVLVSTAIDTGSGSVLDHLAQNYRQRLVVASRGMYQNVLSKLSLNQV